MPLWGKAGQDSPDGIRGLRERPKGIGSDGSVGMCCGFDGSDCGLMVCSDGAALMRLVTD